MTDKQPSNPSEEEVLLAFSVEPVHDRTKLERYLIDYPAYADALIACSIELMVDPPQNVEVEATSEAAVGQAWQRFQFAVSKSDKATLINPFAALNSAAFRSLAKALGINNLLLIRLRDRAIIAATIPHRFVQTLAAALGATTDVVMDYLCCPPAIVSEQSFRSTEKPSVAEQIPFEKAVLDSQLSPEQLEALKALQD